MTFLWPFLVELLCSQLLVGATPIKHTTLLICSPFWLTKPGVGSQLRPIESILWLTSHHSDSLLRTGINTKRDCWWLLVLNSGAWSSHRLRDLVHPSTKIGNQLGERGRESNGAKRWERRCRDATGERDRNEKKTREKKKLLRLPFVLHISIPIFCTPRQIFDFGTHLK